MRLCSPCNPSPRFPFNCKNKTRVCQKDALLALSPALTGLCVLPVSPDAGQPQGGVAGVQLRAGPRRAMHLHGGGAGAEPVLPGCQEQAAAPAAGKGRVLIVGMCAWKSPFLAKEVGGGGRGGQGPPSVCSQKESLALPALLC